MVQGCPGVGPLGKDACNWAWSHKVGSWFPHCCTHYTHRSAVSARLWLVCSCTVTFSTLATVCVIRQLSPTCTRCAHVLDAASGWLPCTLAGELPGMACFSPVLLSYIIPPQLKLTLSSSPSCRPEAAFWVVSLANFPLCFPQHDLTTVCVYFSVCATEVKNWGPSCPPHSYSILE